MVDERRYPFTMSTCSCSRRIASSALKVYVMFNVSHPLILQLTPSLMPVQQKQPGYQAIRSLKESELTVTGIAMPLEVCNPVETSVLSCLRRAAPYRGCESTASPSPKKLRMKSSSKSILGNRVMYFCLHVGDSFYLDSSSWGRRTQTWLLHALETHGLLGAV